MESSSWHTQQSQGAEASLGRASMLYSGCHPFPFKFRRFWLQRASWHYGQHGCFNNGFNNLPHANPACELVYSTSVGPPPSTPNQVLVPLLSLLPWARVFQTVTLNQSLPPPHTHIPK